MGSWEGILRADSEFYFSTSAELASVSVIEVPAFVSSPSFGNLSFHAWMFFVENVRRKKK